MFQRRNRSAFRVNFLTNKFLAAIVLDRGFDYLKLYSDATIFEVPKTSPEFAVCVTMISAF
jgi:hypothetical protein